MTRSDIPQNLMDRLAKLLRMAADASSPNEAAIAARRARALMDKHQISEREVVLRDMSDGSAMDSATFALGIRRASTWRGILGLAVARLNDCNVIWSTHRSGTKAIIFRGHRQDANFAAWLYEALEQAVEKSLEADRLITWGRKECYRYRVGFAGGVALQVQDILAERNREQATAGQALMVVKKQLVDQHFGATRTSRTYTSSDSHGAMDRGRERGRNANLGRPLEGGGTSKQLSYS